ncbi:MAG: NAD(P)-dependent oxidoreductase [Candidatus Omnitrophica bacterium]|nr:NAD(P)-dependent oxidoreductase [Candidatus Omnitrophota bacterium]
MVKRRCLVVGANGLIGRCLLDLLTDKWQVAAISRKHLHGRDDDGITWINCDLNNRLDMRLLPKKTDAVVYLAQSDHFRMFPKRADDIFNVNVAGVLAFLQYARRAGAGTFILASSGGVRESICCDSSKEVLKPVECDIEFYHSTKLCAELLARQYAKFFNIIILRFFFVYGPGQRKDMLIPRLISAVKEGKEIILHGINGDKINPIHVSDAAKAVRATLELKESRIIEIAGPKIYTMRMVGEIIGRCTGKKPVFRVRYDGRPRRRIVGDITQMSRYLHAPSVALKEGIKSVRGEE